MNEKEERGNLKGQRLVERDRIYEKVSKVQAKRAREEWVNISKSREVGDHHVPVRREEGELRDATKIFR